MIPTEEERTLDLDATPMRAFLKVAEKGSFTRAAEELNLSQPALSATIRELERRIGFQLFERTSRRVSLTREGRALLVNAKRVVLETEWMRQRAREIRTNDLRVAVQHHSVLIPERVELTDGFIEQHPDNATQVLTLSHSGLYEALRNDDADLAIVVEPSGGAELTPINPIVSGDFEVEVLMCRDVGLLVPAGHALWLREEIDGEELDGLPVAAINRVHGGAVASAVTRFLDELGAKVLRTPEGDAISVMRHAMRHGVLATDLGWFEVPGRLQNGLRRLQIRGARASTDLLLLRRRRDPRPAAELFWAHALEWRGDVPDRTAAGDTGSGEG